MSSRRIRLASSSPFPSVLPELLRLARQSLLARATIVRLAVLGLALCASPALTLAQTPSSNGQDAELEGTLEILHEDSPNGSRYTYFLHSGGARYSLHFADGRPEHLLTGATIRVKGVQVGNTLALGGGSGNVKTVAAAPTPSTLGAQQTLVILVNFQDNPTEPYTIADAQTAVFGAASNFFLEGSYNQTWLAGDVVGWFTIALSSTVCDVTTLATEAQAAASAAGANLSTYTHYVYIFQNACGGLGLSTVGGNPSQSWINGTLELRVIAHELGHGLGLWHSHALECGTVTLGLTCTVYEYDNFFDAMETCTRATTTRSRRSVLAG